MKTLTADPPNAKSKSYAPRSIKRVRRTKASIEAIAEAAIRILDSDHPCTIRQLFYRLVSERVIEKTEADYKGTLIRLVVRLRLEGRVPWDYIADSTRWVRGPTTHNGLGELLQDAKRTYRRDLWRSQPAYVEVWCEKDALAGVLSEETYPLGVSLMVCRGYPSITYLQSCASALVDQEKPCFLYYFGDHDPSGVDIQANVERRLREFAPDADITFTKIGVTAAQIQELKLPTRPTKKTDTRSKSFRGRSVDVDAIPPHELRKLCREAIEQHIDRNELRITLLAEESERAHLETMIGKLSPRRRGGRTS